MTRSDLSDGPVERFSVNGSVAAGSVVLGLVFGLIGLSMLAVSKASPGDRVFGCVLIGVALWFTYRGVRTGKVVVSGDEVTTRSFLRTRRYRVDALAGVEVRVGQTGPNGFRRQYLVLRRTDGGQVAFKDLNCRPARPGEPQTVVERAAEAIQKALDTPHG